MRIELGDIAIEVVQKDIKNVHLGVYPPSGRVKISAPLHMKLETIRVYAISKLGWIKQQQLKFRNQEREPPREYLDRESHFVWGRRYLFEAIERDGKSFIEVAHCKMILRAQPGTDDQKKHAIVVNWHRHQLRQAAASLIAKWQPIMGVKVKRLFLQKMKTKWGSCNAKSESIRLNTELAKKPPECLEYIIVHEMVHLSVRRHDEQFTRLMDGYLPGWRLIRQTLNEAPLGHVDWTY